MLDARLLFSFYYCVEEKNQKNKKIVLTIARKCCKINFSTCEKMGL